MDENRYLDLHLTQLAQWVVNTIGKALLLSAGVGLVVGYAVAAVDPALAFGAIFVALLTFGYVLWTAQSPLPADLED